MEKIIQDNELGTILLRTSPRAVRYTLKIARGMITATMPQKGDEGFMLSFIEENKAQLMLSLAKHPARPLLDDTTELKATTFRVHIFCADRTNFYMTLKDGVLHIACPLQADFADEQVQVILKSFVEKALRHEAHRLLPARLMGLAAKHNFTCTGVKIFNSKTHWGSCTPRKSINLSLSLMLLPWHLVDYVLLHELCHTVEMNHSDRFWTLLNGITDNKALALRAELKKYHIL